MKKVIWKVVLAVLLGFVGVVLVVLYTNVKLADIRPAGTKETPRAKVWVEKARKAHGGLLRWSGVKQAKVEMTGVFPSSLIRRALGPFGANRVRLSWTYTPARPFPVRIEEVKKAGAPVLYVCDRQESYQMRGGEKQENPRRLRFFVRAIRHLLDFVFAMGSADIVQDAGDATWEGRQYVRIYMTWRSAKPSRELDQYVLWINKKTQLMDRFDSTGRRVLPWIPTPFIKSRVEFRKYHKRNGLQVPSSIMVYRAGTKTLVHGYLLHKASFTPAQPAL